ncbi:MAG: HprK-related kinase B [Gammaproteobacteria bacterium]|nr:HprK-related kinase B [Gammaproteobacteria bacterium]
MNSTDFMNNSLMSSDLMRSNETTIEALSSRVCEGRTVDNVLELKFGQCRIRLDTNSAELVQRLEHYFKPFINDDGVADIQLTALEMPAPDLGLEFTDWKRDPGKVGRKDSFIDLADGRVCRKVRTGMQYLLSDTESLVFGECLKNDNQVVNFLISLYITWLLHRDNVLCHAAALSRYGEGFAIAAFSGGGKSTLALHLMRKGFDFVSNDRTLIAKREDGVFMSGVPKQPRINPGTVLHNPALAGVIPQSRLAQLAKISQQEIWDLEEKYDADVEAIFGAGKFQLYAKLKAFVILNWKRDDSSATKFKRVDIARRPDLLAAVMKSPGPFYMLPGNKAPATIVETDPDDYIPVLSQVDVYEVTGAVDFDQAVDFCVKEFT